MERREALMLGVRGTLAIVFGILAVIWPGLTVIVLAVLFGVFAVATGIEQLVHATRDHGSRVARIVTGVVGLAAGILAIVWPGPTAVILAVTVGVWAIATGVADLWLATREQGGWWLALAGAVSIVAGLFVLVRPAAGAVAVAWAIGLYAIVSGALMLVGMWQLTHHTSGRGRPAAAGI